MGTPTARSTRARSVPSSTRCSRASAPTRRSTRCPTPRRCAGRAPTSARSPSTSPASWCTCAPRWSTPTAATPCPRPRRSPCGPRPGAWRMPAGCACGERLAGVAGRLGRRRGMPGGRRALSWLPVAGIALDPGPRPAAAAGGVVPGLVAPGRPRRGAAMTARDEVLASGPRRPGARPRPRHGARCGRLAGTGIRGPLGRHGARCGSRWTAPRCSTCSPSGSPTTAPA